MGFFSSITKSFKRLVKKAVPILTKVAPFIPALAPFAPLIAGAGTAFNRGARPPPLPIQRRLPGRSAPIGQVSFTRGPQAAPLPPSRPRGFGPSVSTIPQITFGENQQISAAIQLGQAAFNRGPIAGPSPVVLQRPPVGSPIFSGGIPVAIGSLITGIGRTLFGGGRAAVGGGALALGGAAGNLVLSSTGRILAVITASGARIGRKRAVAIAKFLGLNAGAAALGIGIVELAQMTVDETGRPRRRRGITARDFATTRRTMTKIKSMHAMLPTRGTSRRSPAHVRTAAITHG